MSVQSPEETDAGRSWTRGSKAVEEPGFAAATNLSVPVGRSAGGWFDAGNGGARMTDR